MIEFLTRIFETDESEKVQAVICIGLAKLMLSGMISDENVSTYRSRYGSF